jgi:TonB-linked SusC/RagA family outer membrane protein
MKKANELYAFMGDIKNNFTSMAKGINDNCRGVIIIVLLLIGFGVQTLSAQKAEDKVTFELKNQSLNQALTQLGKMSGFKMAYTLQQVEKFKSINVEKQTRTVGATLEALLANTNLTYKIKGNNIMIVEKKSGVPSVRSKKKISGLVLDNDENPLPGVTVAVAGTTIGTITASDGNFTLDAPEDGELVFSFVGFETTKVKVSDESNLRVVLSTNQNILDEVQVIGYGTTTRRLKTSGVATIKAEEIQNQPSSTNFLQSMQGKLAGVVINQTGGGVGNSPQLYVRGINSITSGNSPLYIVDGVIITDETLDNASTGGMTGPYSSHNALSSVSQADIISIDVLKDADATAIYGSRGANGVVLITTKRAQTGKTTFTLDANTGFNSPITTKYLNLDQYLAMRKEAFAVNGLTPTATNAPDLLKWSQTDGTDWTKKLNSNSGKIYNINGTLTGGTKGLSYLASLGYNEIHDTYIADPYSKKFNGKLNVNHTSEDNRLNASFNASFSNENYKPGFGYTSSNSTTVYTLPPNFSIRDADGKYFWGEGSLVFGNPYAFEESSTTSNTKAYLLSTDVSYRILKGLTAKMSVSYNYQNNDNIRKLYSVSLTPTGTDAPGVKEALSTYSSLNIEPQLAYKVKVGKGNLDALLGSTWFTKTNEYKQVTLTNFQSEAFYDAWSAAGTSVLVSDYSKYNMRSWFGRVGYNWDNKYIANATYRADGSSRFGTNNRWGQFWALGGAWLYSNESFVKKALPWLSYGKLRTSYGITGNDKIPDYRFSSLYSTSYDAYTPVYYNGATGLLPTYLPNKDIKWEQTSKFEVAAENSFFNDRLSTSVAYFFNRTTKMLLDVTVPGQTGFDIMLQNFPGIVDNKGLEIEINSVNLKTKDFSWRTNLNITFQKNVLTKLPSGTSTDYSYQYFEGKSIENYSSSKAAGIDPATGNVQWINATTGEIQSTPDNTSQYLGSRFPTIFGGLTNTLGYKGFELSFLISFAKQTMTDALYYANLPGKASNLPTMIIGKYWSNAGDNARYPKLDATGTNYDNDDFVYSNLVMHDGFYFKLQNISLTYTVPDKWISPIKVSGLSLYLRGQNLFYVTPGIDLGKDPERFSAGGLTLARTFVAGLNIKF